MFELGARPHPPRELYRAYLAQSDVFVGIYWRRYGWVAPGEPVSGLEDEYLLSGDRPKLIYVKAADGPGAAAGRSCWPGCRSTTAPRTSRSTDAAELAELVADDLAVLLTERFAARGPAQGLRRRTAAGAADRDRRPGRGGRGGRRAASRDRQCAW